MALIPFLLLSIISLSTPTSHGAKNKSIIGVCYGRVGNNLPNATESINLIRTKLKTKYVKIYDADPDVLNATKNTDIEISIMLPTELIPNVSADQSLADDWVSKNVVPYNESKIRHVLVGNEVLSNQTNTTWFQLVPAMKKIRTSLKTFHLNKIKVGTPLAMDCLESSFPPSNGTFRSTIRDEVIVPLLRFLNHTNSFFHLHAYPYFALVAQPEDIRLDYALLEPDSGTTVTDTGSNLTYHNLLDQMLDAVFYAMKRLNYSDIPISLAETGWPSGGGPKATVKNAETYNNNVLRVVNLGTPARPNYLVPTMIFALFNENNKSGLETERNFGLLYPNGTRVYPIDLSGKTSY